MSFLRHGGIYRSDDACSTGSKRSGSLPVLIGLDEFRPAIPRQVALQQSLPPLRRPRTILQNKTSPYNDLSANGNNPLNSVSQHKGSLQTLPPMPIAKDPTTALLRRLDQLHLSVARPMQHHHFPFRIAEHEHIPIPEVAFLDGLFQSHRP